VQRDYTIDAPAFGLTAATAASIIGLITGAVCPVDIIELTLGCDATSTGLLKVELMTATSDGTGTSYTPKAENGDASLVAAASTAKIKYTVEPTTTTVLQTLMLPLPTSPIDLMKALGRELTIAVSTKFYVRLTSTTVSPNAYCTLHFEE
jgi:hypothetical protein